MRASRQGWPAAAAESAGEPARETPERCRVTENLHRDAPPASVSSEALRDTALWAAEIVRRSWPETPRVGLILGTGLGDLSRHMEHEFELRYEEIPGMAACTALSHAGKIVGGRVGRAPVLIFEGRVHRYEGYSNFQVTLPVRLMAALGVETLVLSNASGGLNPQLASGDVLVIRGHLNFMGGRPEASTGSEANRPTARSFNGPYCPQLARRALEIARARNFHAAEGVYAAMSGPNYETRAEYRMLRRLGADVVGMSTVPEALAASSLGMRVLALSAVTNIATPDAPKRTTAEEVVAAAAAAEPRIRAIVLEIAAESAEG